MPIWSDDLRVATPPQLNDRLAEQAKAVGSAPAGGALSRPPFAACVLVMFI